LDNKYLSYDAQRAPRVREMFSRIAWKYDLVNDVMSFGLHRRWKRQTAELAVSGAAGTRAPRVLDLCCGSGDVCFLAEDLGARSVVGVDFTLPMLAVARERRRSAGRGRGDGGETHEGGHRGPVAEERKPGFVQADALALPFADGTFDALTISYGLRNIADLDAAMREMRRVLAPGGRAVVLDFGKPDNALAGAAYRAFLRALMPAVGWLFHGDPETYLYIPASLERFPAQRGVEKMMREAGFANVRYENRLLGTMGINVGEAGAPVGS
jgi:demethylmenaquinone methyltransferase / 2-methoxy-6-polyprenyl-1,4-benzoquinol methylase